MLPIEPPRKLARVVEGNHFFFLGMKGAKETANQLERLLKAIKDTEQEFRGLVGNQNSSPNQ